MDEQHSDELSHKREMFARAFLKHGNASQAVIDAGYTDNRESAYVIASRLRKDPLVREFLNEQKKIIAIRHGINLDWNFEKLKEIVEIHSKTYVSDQGEKMIDAKAALSALDTISKQLGYYEPEKVEHKLDEFNPDQDIVKNFSKEY